MKRFSQYLREMEYVNDDEREFLYRVLARLSHFGPKDIEHAKDMLIELQKMVEDKLTGV